MTTPIGGGIRSLNVKLRQELDLVVEQFSDGKTNLEVGDEVTVNVNIVAIADGLQTVFGN